MGREATCRCQWGIEEAEVRALLETHELILRGGMRRSVSLGSIQNVSAKADSLRFQVGEDWVTLKLGTQAAARWAEAIANPPTLAKKLGISSGKRIRTFGFTQDEALREAFKQARSEPGGEADLLFFVVRTPEELEEHLTRSQILKAPDRSVWIVYPKGKGKEINEAHVRETMRSHGMVDTKVASVSEDLTALRFSHRKGETTREKARKG
jgi:hypothetical protein